MTKIDIISGFLGAGKTTLIKKLLQEALNGQKVVLIENEFGEIGIDGGFLKDAGIQITEMNSGCICCSLVGDFGAALKKVVEQYHPDRIIIEPSGVGKLSDVIAAVMNVAGEIDLDLNSFVTVADATKCKMYMKNFGEFYNNQVESANTIILSRTQGMKEEKLAQAVSMIQEKNAKAKIITTPWDELTGEQILAVMEQGHSLAEELMEEAMKLHEEEEHEHHHHHLTTMMIAAAMTMITSIIITMTTMITSMSTIIITTIMTTTSAIVTSITTIMTIMSIIMTMTSMARSAPVAATIMIIITIIMQMRYLPAGARRLLESIQRKSLMKFLLSCLRRPSLVLS